MNRFMIVLLLLPLAAATGQTEFVVNSTLDSTQRDPQIARDASGNYVVVWKSVAQVDSASRGDIYLRFFDSQDQPVGGESLVNTITTGDQDKPAIAVSASGNLVVAWASHSGFSTIYDIKGRLYKNRSPVGGEFSVNSTVDHSQTHPSVAIHQDGSFVIVWDSWFQDGSDRGVYAQLFDSAGVPVGTEFQVNTTTAYSQARPDVRFLSDGRFVVIWESWKQDVLTPSGYGLIGRIFAQNGTPETSEFQVNAYTNDYQWFGDLAILDENSFVVAWCSWEQDGDDGGIYVRRFDDSGNPLGDEMRINRTTVHYQWLPKIRRTGEKNFAVVWSSWKQDGSREGVYAQLFDSTGTATSFETRVNDYVDNFQWEPDFIPTGGEELLVVWSSWGQTGQDYDIIGKRITPTGSQTHINRATYNHFGGRSTTQITAHVVDSSALTGHEYEVWFDSLDAGNYLGNVRDLATGDTVLSGYPVDREEGIFYLTPEFDGVVLEIEPEYELELDLTHSYSAISSGTNLILTPGLPTAGVKLLAPIDLALIWGSPDTLADGRYVAPLDTALNIAGQAAVQVPFRARNRTDQEDMTILIVETKINQKFDPGERIVFLTPDRYRTQGNNTHAEISTSLPGGTLIWPQPGDTTYVLTTRPLTTADLYRFTTDPATIVNVGPAQQFSQMEFELEQNYPNPFNPSTTIAYTLPVGGHVTISVYNVLGQRVKILTNQIQNAGRHRVLLEGNRLSTGVYFYRLEFEGRVVTKRMVLLK